MVNFYKLNYIPFRVLSFLFVIYNNSDYAVIGKNAGFYCDDKSIRRSYHGDSIHAKYLLTSLLVVVAIIVYISERLHTWNRQQELVDSDWKLFLKYYYTGFVHIMACIEALKIFVTELRPHFFYTCLPDMSQIDCSKGLITNFTCTGEGEKWLVNRDIYKSFPSGHAALSMFAFVYISIYLYSKRNATPFQIWWTRVVVFLFFIWTVLCSVSRIFDNRHFWWDVLIGDLIGLSSGLVMIWIALNKAHKEVKSTD